MNNSIRIIFIDLDGTLLNSDRDLSPANLQCLDDLKGSDIIRVITTGGSIYSFNRVFPTEIPVDYLIFSTRAGIVDIDAQQLLYSSNLTAR